MKEKPIITISRHSNVDRDGLGLHSFRVCIPNDGVDVKSTGDTLVITAKWDATRFYPPRIEENLT